MAESSHLKAEPRSLGTGNLQASPGDHTHDGTTSKRLLEGIELTGSKGGNAALTNLIALLVDHFGLTDSTT